MLALQEGCTHYLSLDKITFQRTYTTGCGTYINTHYSTIFFSYYQNALYFYKAGWQSLNVTNGK
jgi:hypothetical protein